MAHFSFRATEMAPLPTWLVAQANTAANGSRERERLLEEGKSSGDALVCHSRVRTAIIVITLLCTMGLLATVSVLVWQATATMTSARDAVAPSVKQLLNVSMQMAEDTRSGINSLRHASRNAEVFSDVSFQELSNATAHVHALTEHLDRSMRQPLTLSLKGR